MEIDVLYIEDNPSDIELFKAVVETTSATISLTVVEELSDIQEKLKQGVDVIISDFNLKGFDGLHVLDVAKSIAPDTPLIFFSSTLGEEKAVELIRKGATDFVLKDNITKIPWAIDRAMEEVKLREERKIFEYELIDKNELLFTLFNSLTDLVFLKDMNGEITKVNSAFCDFFHTTAQNVIGKTEELFLSHQESLMADKHVFERKEVYNYEIDILDASGSRKILGIIKSPLIKDSGVEGVVAVARDITDKRLLEERNSKDKQILQQAENHTKAGSFELDRENDILSVSPNFMQLLNLKSDRNFISSSKLINCVHPEDRPLFLEKFNQAVSNQIDFEIEHRYIPQNYSKGFKYCKTVFKAYPNPHKTVYYGTILDTTESREASLALLNIQEQERERISKELHDNVSPKLSAASMFLDGGEKDLEKVQRLVDESIADIRGLSRLLTTSVLENSKFSDALGFLIENTPNSEIINLHMDFSDDRIPDFAGGQLYRILQEALNNTMKYAEATRIELKLWEQKHTLNLLLTDDGKGFDEATVKLGNGIRNMKERVRNCSGQFQIKSQPNKGTSMIIKIPLHSEMNLVEQNQ